MGSGSFQFGSGQCSYHNLLQPTVSRIFEQFLVALVSKASKYIKFPRSEEELTLKKQGFYKKYGFPNVIGAIDGTHIQIQKPALWDAYAFFNRKGVYSINVQAVNLHYFIRKDVPLII